MISEVEVKSNKMWVDVMKGYPATFNSSTETRVICRDAVMREVLQDKAEEIVGLTIADRKVDIYIRFETMKRVKELLIEAIEDFEV